MDSGTNPDVGCGLWSWSSLALYEEIPEAEGGGIFATVEELPEVITEGRTLDESRRNLRDPLELVLEDDLVHTARM
jgi:predicted RNase H-like HicB family nuclease